MVNRCRALSQLLRIHAFGRLATTFHLAAAVFLTSAVSIAHAQDEQSNAADEQKLLQQWKQTYDAIMDSIQVAALAPDGTELELVRAKVLSVNNPDHDGRHGFVYLFTHQGKPKILSSLMSKTAADNEAHRTVSYEFHSLCEETVFVRKGGRSFWSCRQPGITWSEETDAEKVATGAARRLTQMRSIASRFSVKLIDANQPEDCRLLPQPIYRYQPDTPDVDDGAIFAYVTSGNPKVYLLMEGRQGKWHIAFARSGRWKLEVSRDGKIVQMFDAGTFQKPGPFYQIYNAESRLANDPSTIINLKFPD